MGETILNWINTHESIGIWVEAIALVAIFMLDWRERKDQRKDRDEQHKETLAQLQVSKKQVEASQEQAEAMQKPCLMLSTTARPSEDAVLDMGDAVGGMMLLCPGRNVQLQNVGSGAAVNIRYIVTPTNLAASIARPNGYLVGVRPGEAFPIPLSCEILRNHEWEVVFTYESLSGSKYQTRSIVNDLILTNIQFGRMSD
jgi:hypothetical protein